MTATAARISTAAVAAFLSIATLGGAQAAQTQQDADPQLCAEYLQDLAAYRRMAVLAGCEIPDAAQAPAAAVRTAELADDAGFPPVITGEAEPQETNFPPVIIGSSAETPTSEAETSSETDVPPVVEASTEPAQADVPPATSEESTSSGEETTSSSEESTPMGESHTSPPVVTGHREEIEEKLILLKEEAKERIKQAVILKAEEVKDRIKQKIKDKLEHATQAQEQNGPNLRSKAKQAVKHMIAEHHSGNHTGGGLLSKLSQLRNR